MSANVHQLIGIIINPGLPNPAPALRAARRTPSEPLHVLIGRTMGPPGGRSAEPQIAMPTPL